MSHDLLSGRLRSFTQWAPKRRTSDQVQVRPAGAPVPPNMPPFPLSRPGKAKGNGPWISPSSPSGSFAIAVDGAGATPSDSSRQPAAPTPLAIFPQVIKPTALLASSSSNLHSTRNHTLIPEFSRFQKNFDQRDRELNSRPMGLYAPRGEPKISPALTFHHFARLPAEVRLRIWALLNPPPQIFHVSYEKILHSPRWNPLSRKWEYWGTWCILSPKPRLLNLFICQESRHECRKLYSIVRLLHDNK